MDKVFNSFREAIADIPDGATIMLGGWAYAGTPQNLILALREHRAKELTIITGSTGTQRYINTNVLIENKQVKRVTCTIAFPGTPADRAYQAGEIELQYVPQGTLAEAIRAAGAGIGGFYTRTAVLEHPL
jgi:3-oxoacid CoA-transferase A subunit